MIGMGGRLVVIGVGGGERVMVVVRVKRVKVRMSGHWSVK